MFEGNCEIGFVLKPRGYSITFYAGGRGSVPIFGVRHFTLDKYLRSVHYNMDKNSTCWVHKSEKKRRNVEFGAGLRGIRLNIWGPQNNRLDYYYRGQQRNNGMVLKVRESGFENE